MTSENGETRPSTDDPVGCVTVRGRYRIIGPGIASGDAVTYAAEDVMSRRPVAISVLRGTAAADAEFVAAVREQAYRLAKPVCHHRAMVRVYDVGTTDEGEPFVALEPAVGRSLREVLDERGTLGFHDGLRLAIEIGESLETLHRSGIVHGELRPEAVVIVKDENGKDAVKLVGVELTAARRTLEGLRNRDEAVAAYLAPEQIARAETTEAADVHALGLLILEVLTGHRPHGGGRGAAELPPAIARIVAKALEEGPGRRYSSISLMVNDMWSAEGETPPSSAVGATPALGERRSTARRRARTDVGMAISLVVGLILVGVTAWVVRSDRLGRSVSSEAEPVVAASPVAPVHAPTPAAPTSDATPSTISKQPTLPASPPAPAPSAPVRSEVTPVRDEVPTPLAAKPAPVGAVVRSPRPVARQIERPASTDQPSADGGDGTAIIDWLLKGRRSGG
jgi:serine/threonine protein kinase